MTWTREQALQAARKHLLTKYQLGDDAVIFLDSFTRERPYGWVFFYESRRFVETGDIMHAFGGNGPLVADAERERIFEVGTANGVEAELSKTEWREGLMVR